MHPTTAARIARERERDRRQVEARDALARLLSAFVRVAVTDRDEAQRAWSLPSLRTYLTHYEAGGTPIVTTVRGIDGEWFIQEAHFPGWRFSRLVLRDDHDAHVKARDARDARARALVSFAAEMGAALLPQPKGGKR